MDDRAGLHRLREIELRTRVDDGSWTSRPLWIVGVDGEGYVRAAFGRRSQWLRSALSGAPMRVEAPWGLFPVRLEPVLDSALEDRVSEAYRAKYGPGWPGPVRIMTGAEARSTTMRIAAV
ncbi:DUF2255 family protein [Streptomyces stackebrandtii]|uniref:DUF2255 family protein n=1 Tax=Streptomyces stackebrandtii TaxID=3051177 RepID=UPI0028DB2112|nr:DUF2255 family protein [Streptomyces sp. DSM 40976]